MTTSKSLTMVAALLVGGTSLALAQVLPRVATRGGAGGNPAVPGPPGPGVIPGAPLQSAAPATRTRASCIITCTCRRTTKC